MEPQSTPPPVQNQVNINLHQQKLYALIGGGLSLIALLLPWITVGGVTWKNGFAGWGILSLLGVLGIIVVSFLGDKTKPYDENFKKYAMAAFGAVVLGALITLFTKNNAVGGMYRGYAGGYVKAGFGVWLALIAGGAGLAWVAGLIKMPPAQKKIPPTN